MAASSIIELLSAQAEVPQIRVVDVGANPLLGQKGPYQPLVEAGAASVLGFEPDPEAFAELEAIQGPGERFLPLAVGDGRTHTLRICRMSGMNSLLEPDASLLEHLHHHRRWGQVVRTVDVPTVRLDDVPEIEGMDLLKIDIQGGELMVFENGRERLKDCLVVQSECMLVPMYEGQPLYSEQELELRRHGLRMHRFVELASHILRPFLIAGDGHRGFSQMFWIDVVFIKDFTKPERLTSGQLLKLAVILHEIYRSFDVARVYLAVHDQRHGTSLAKLYYEWILETQPPRPPPILCP